MTSCVTMEIVTTSCSLNMKIQIGREGEKSDFIELIDALTGNPITRISSH